MNGSYKSRRSLRFKRKTRRPYRRAYPLKSFKTNLQSIKATYTTRVYLSDARKYGLVNPGQEYVNLAYILAQSPEFISRTTQYSYYKVTGIKVTLTRMWLDPVSNGLHFTLASMRDGLEMISLNFYPNLTSGAVGQAIENADSSWNVSPFATGPVAHSISFPNGFTQGPNAQGLGTWNSVGESTNISGQLSCYNSSNGASASAGTQVAMWDVQIQVYVSFTTNTGA